MRPRSIFVSLTLAAVSLATAGAVNAQQRGPDTRPGIAVLPFHNGGSYGQDKENFDALEVGIAAMLISELSSNPAARIVEREDIQKILEEQNMGSSGRVDPQTAARIGKLVGARYVVAGRDGEVSEPLVGRQGSRVSTRVARGSASLLPS